MERIEEIRKELEKIGDDLGWIDSKDMWSPSDREKRRNLIDRETELKKELEELDGK